MNSQLGEAERKLEEVEKEQEALIDLFSEERIRRDKEEEKLRKMLKVRAFQHLWMNEWMNVDFSTPFFS